jgi:xanthine dehydrogenase accessory factor
MNNVVYIPDAEPYQKLIALVRDKKPAVLATVVETDGSTPQVAGASALFAADGLVCGTVGGGIGEARVEVLARRALRTGTSVFRTFDFGKTPDEAGEAICGGRLRVLIDARPARHIAAFLAMGEAARKRRAGLLAVRIGRTGDPGRVTVRRFWVPIDVPASSLVKSPLLPFEADLRAAARSGVPGTFCRRTERLYVEPHLPPPRLLIAGAGHVGRAAAHLGRLLDFEVVVIDDRPEFANPERFPEAGRIIVADVARALRALPVGQDTYIVIVTRGHRHDEDALRACVRRKAAYIGMIGSARKVGLLRDRFVNNRWCSPAEWARVRTPIGLPIGSKTVEEIAVSIAAELVSVRSCNSRAYGTGSSALRSARRKAEGGA